MAVGLLGIWIGGLAILCSGFFYTRAMLMALREQAITPLTPLPKTGRGGTPGRRQKRSPLPAVLGRGAGGEGLPSDDFRRLGRRAFYVAMGGALLAAAVLWVMILGQHYEVEYVWKVTDQALPLRFRIASFWAEQEGTFLLWLIYGFILSTVLLRRLGKTEPFVMPFICAVQLFPSGRRMCTWRRGRRSRSCSAWARSPLSPGTARASISCSRTSG